MNKVYFLMLIIATIVCHVLKAQERYVVLDSLLTTRYLDQKFSGVVIVAEGNEITYANALGYAD